MKRHTLLTILAGSTLFLLTGSAPGQQQPPTDRLTGLPLYPGTRPAVGTADPMELPGWSVCKSNAKGNFYLVFNSKVDATVAWYAAHLPGFKRTHGYAANRSQDTFYKSDGSVLVGVTGTQGKDGENTDAYSVVYIRLQPPASEKTIIGMNLQKVVCQ